MKETRRKGTIVSQLAIRKFSDITGKHMNTPCFYFCMVFLENQNVSHSTENEVSCGFDHIFCAVSSTYLQHRNTSSGL